MMNSLYYIIACNRRSSVPEIAVVFQGGGAAVFQYIPNLALDKAQPTRSLNHL
jgi:hypothetical protein